MDVIAAALAADAFLFSNARRFNSGPPQCPLLTAAAPSPADTHLSSTSLQLQSCPPPRPLVIATNVSRASRFTQHTCCHAGDPGKNSPSLPVDFRDAITLFLSRDD